MHCFKVGRVVCSGIVICATDLGSNRWLFDLLLPFVGVWPLTLKKSTWHFPPHNGWSVDFFFSIFWTPLETSSLSDTSNHVHHIWSPFNHLSLPILMLSLNVSKSSSECIELLTHDWMITEMCYQAVEPNKVATRWIFSAWFSQTQQSYDLSLTCCHFRGSGVEKSRCLRQWLLWIYALIFFLNTQDRLPKPAN